MDVPSTLPDSILAKIFSYSDNVTLGFCFQANNDWESIIEIDGYFGEFDKRLWTCKTKETPIFKPLANIGDHYVTQAWISESRPGAEIPQEQLQWKDPQMLKTLWLDGYVSPTTFNNLTLSTENLHELILHTSVFNRIDTDKYNFENKFPNLEIFSMKFRALRRYPITNVAQCVSKQISMLDNELTKFPKLKDFTFEPIYLQEFVIRYKEAIYSFITRHAHTLKNLSILFIARGMSRTRSNGLDERSMAVMNWDLGLFNLDMVEFVGCSASKYARLTENKNLISITYLKGYDDYLYTKRFDMNFLLPTLQTHSYETLKSLILDLKLPTHQPLDLSIFKTCHNLEILGLRIPRYTDIKTQSLLIGSKNLPNSIQKIELINFLISNAGCKGLFHNRRKLKYMHVVSNENSDPEADFGFACADLNEIFDQQVIEEFHIHGNGSFNRKMIEDELNSTDSTIWKLALTFRQQSYIHYHYGAKLNLSTGSYKFCENELNSVPDFNFPYLGRKQNGHFPFNDEDLSGSHSVLSENDED